MLSHKKSLNILKKTDALLEGHFVLSSGLHSSKYVQCAKLLSYPYLADKICISLAKKIKKRFKNIDLILAPAMGGIIVGYEVGKILNKETIFSERVNGEFKLRRDFSINKNQKVLIIEDVIQSKNLHQIESFLHFHPNCNINVEKHIINIDSAITIVFKNHRNLTIKEYDFSLGFNKTKKAFKIRTLAEKKSKIEISYEN